MLFRALPTSLHQIVYDIILNYLFIFKSIMDSACVKSKIKEEILRQMMSPEAEYEFTTGNLYVVFHLDLLQVCDFWLFH